MHPFSPYGLPTQELAATTSAIAVQLSIPDIVGSHALRIEGDPSATVYIRFGSSEVTVTAANGMGIKPGSIETFGVGPRTTHIAVIVASGTGTVRVTTGQGL